MARPSDEDKLTSLNWPTFIGLNNRQRPEDLQPGELTVARNVDINDAGRVSRRVGQTSFKAGNYKCMWSPEDQSILLAVKSGNLYRIWPDKTETVIRTNVGDSDMFYEYVNGTVIYSNGSIISTVVNGVDIPLVNPTKAFKVATPAMTNLAYYKSRLYGAVGNVLCITDVLSYNQIDKRNGFKQLPSNIKMIKAVDGGLYVSDSDNTYFVSGPSPEKMTPIPVAKAAISGSLKTIKGKKISGDLQGTVLFFTTIEGIYMGMSDGTVIPITLRNYKLPSAKRVAVLVRDESGKLQLIMRLYN